ncbi:MAG: hypothetical protein NUV67_05200 [archaeon]|nr:hypothetical protein [archaeon]
MIHLRVPGTLYSKCVQIAKESGFNGVQELTRQALREKVDDIELKASIERIRSAMGTSEVKRLSKKEREELFQSFLKDTEQDKLKLLREFGLEDVRKL